MSKFSVENTHEMQGFYTCLSSKILLANKMAVLLIHHLDQHRTSINQHGQTEINSVLSRSCQQGCVTKYQSGRVF